jgi:alginate O-acetyltransferase complex protein AlgI
VALTFLIVVFGWVLFRSESLAMALTYMTRMMALDGPTAVLTVPVAELIDARSTFVMIVAAILCFVPQIKSEPISVLLPSSVKGTVVYGATAVILLALSTAFLAARGFTPFLYFRF